MNYWHRLVTEKSFDLLKRLRKEYSFILIGGWAIYLYTGGLKSKDIDMVVEYEELGRLKEKFPLTKNDRLKRYEIKEEEIDVDIYVPYYSDPGLPAEVIRKYTTEREGFRVPLPEVLLILKQKAFSERRDSIKGEKDRIDIFSLLKESPVDFALYLKILKEHKRLEFSRELVNLVLTTSEVKEAALNRPAFARLRKEILANISSSQPSPLVGEG